MTTLGQTLANRENAQLSTGPKTAAGKAAAAQNGLTHGLCSARVVVKGEDADAFGLLKTELMADLNPRTAEMQELAERIVGLVWKKQRAEAIETALWESGGGSIEDMAVMLGTHGKEIDRIGRYGRQIAREMSECRAEYRRLEERALKTVAGQRQGVDRMVEMRAVMTAELAAETAKRRVKREAAKAGSGAEDWQAEEASGVQAWNAAYDGVLRQARRELGREPAVRFLSGWELLADSAERLAQVDAERA